MMFDQEKGMHATV
jgi:phospholipid-transporting ATPase